MAKQLLGVSSPQQNFSWHVFVFTFLVYVGRVLTQVIAPRNPTKICCFQGHRDVPSCSHFTQSPTVYLSQLRWNCMGVWHLVRLWTCACFLSLARSKLMLCSANPRTGYLRNPACDWLSLVWSYSTPRKKQKIGPDYSNLTLYQIQITEPILYCGLCKWICGHWVSQKQYHCCHQITLQ